MAETTLSPEISPESATPLSESTPQRILDRLREAETAIRACLHTYDSSVGDERPAGPATDQLELSVVMPCLNEADTLATCIGKAFDAMNEHGIQGEVIVADNGSTDGSIAIAEELGARVVHVEEKGYGSALMGGIESARGRFVIMGDADDSYDFLEIPKFVEKLQEGNDLVQGCRLPRGGGKVLSGAMPRLHRWWGNPMFSWMVRRMFRAPVSDVYCGLRGFTHKHYQQLDLRSTGMEFATEMIIKSTLLKAKITEIPTTLHPDGRKSHAPHLRTFRDGWRTLRFFLMNCPRWLFFTPGMVLCLLGFVGYALAMPGVQIYGATLDAHTLLASSLLLLLGFQLVQFALFAKTFAITEGLVPDDGQLSRIFHFVSLERCLIVGTAAFITGSGLILIAFFQWQSLQYGALDYASTMRLVIPGVTLSALGFQTIFSSFFLSILRMGRKK